MKKSTQTMRGKYHIACATSLTIFLCFFPCSSPLLAAKKMKHQQGNGGMLMIDRCTFFLFLRYVMGDSFLFLRDVMGEEPLRIHFFFVRMSLSLRTHGRRR